MRTSPLWGLALLASLLHGDDLDDLLGDFEQSEEIIIDESSITLSDTNTPLKVSGSLSHSLSYNIAHGAPTKEKTDFRGLSRARTKLNLDFDATLSEHWKSKLELKGFFDGLYFLRSDNHYTDDMRDTYQDEFEAKEVYVLGSYDAFDIKIGRQSVVWEIGRASCRERV